MEKVNILKEKEDLEAGLKTVKAKREQEARVIRQVCAQLWEEPSMEKRDFQKWEQKEDEDIDKHKNTK